MVKRQNREITHLWEMYEEGISSQIKLGLRHIIPRNIEFYEGKQWPDPTEATKNLPRPVINIVKMICRNKKASILSTPVRILYKSYTQNTDTDKLNAFAQCVLKELDQDGLDRLAIDDGIKKGSYFYHYYWDKTAISQTGQVEGGVRCEIIDPLNIFFSNPHNLDEQNQKWILISTPTDKSELRNICGDDATYKTILAEEGDFSDEQSESIIVLTRYFRLDGEVYCERGTKHALIGKPFKLAPDICHLEELLSSSYKVQKQVDVKETEDAAQVDITQPASMILNQAAISSLQAKFERKRKACSLYPIVSGYYERREGSIYGISEVEGLIPNQKAINFNIAMSLLNAQQCAWGKYIALPNALKGQTITNSPGQVLIDHSGTGQGIKRMADVGISQVPVDISEKITEMTRLTTGASEILSGEALNSNLSGVAIAQLQAQAEVPIEELRAEFIKAKRKQGMVLAQFLRLYYFDRQFIRSKSTFDGKEEEICDFFTSNDYRESVLDVIVEPTRGTKATITSDINLLDNCLKNGSISLETYIKAYPEGVISNKHTILHQIEAEKSSKIEALRRELERYKNPKTVDPVSII